jgi:hypothetical protein
MEAGMRNLRHGVVLVAVLLLPVQASAWSSPDGERFSFDLTACSCGATHIVVVEPDGRVVESWRGDLKPGEMVFLGYEGLTPRNTLPWESLRLRPEKDSKAWYQSAVELPAVAPSEVKGTLLILFLRREGKHPNGSGVIWMPAVEPMRALRMGAGSRFDRYPDVPDVADVWPANVAWIEDGRVLVEDGQASGDCEGGMPCVSYSAAEFKERVLAFPQFLLNLAVQNNCAWTLSRCGRNAFDWYCLRDTLDKAQPEFDLRECARNATHILVVNRSGEVLETWKGDTLPGEVIPLDQMCGPVLPQQHPIQHEDIIALPRLAGNSMEQQLGTERFILFLVRSPVSLVEWGYFPTLDFGNVWGRPRTPQPRIHVADSALARVSGLTHDDFALANPWLPACRSGGFACSMAIVDQLGFVRTRQVVSVDGRSYSGYGTRTQQLVFVWSAIANTECAFKSQVLEALGGVQ